MVEGVQDLLEQAGMEYRHGAMWALGIEQISGVVDYVWTRAAAWEELVEGIPFFNQGSFVSMCCQRRAHRGCSQAAVPSCLSFSLSVCPLSYPVALVGMVWSPTASDCAGLWRKRAVGRGNSCSTLMWRWTPLHMGCLSGAASASVHMRRKKLFFCVFYWKIDVTSSNKGSCELLKAALFVSIGDDFSSSNQRHWWCRSFVPV